MSSEPTQAVKELISTWSPADQEWLAKKVPENLQTVAARHGRQLFSLTMQAGSANFCIITLLQNVRGEGRKLVTMLSRVMDDTFQRALKGEGVTIEQFKECRADVERVVELTESGKPAGNNVSPGGIILDS